MHKARWREYLAHGHRLPVGPAEVLHEAEADLLAEGEAVAGRGDGAAELVIPVD